MRITELSHENLLKLYKEVFNLDDSGVANKLDCGGKVTRRYIIGAEEMPERIYKRCITHLRKPPVRILRDRLLKKFEPVVEMKSVQFGMVSIKMADKLDLLRITISNRLGRIIKNRELLSFMINATYEKISDGHNQKNFSLGAIDKEDIDTFNRLKGEGNYSNKRLFKKLLNTYS